MNKQTRKTIPTRKKSSIDANKRALSAAYVNAILTKLDGSVPRRLRLDYETMKVVELVPLNEKNNATRGRREFQPDKLDHVVIFEEKFRSIWNSLFIDEEAGRLFLCNAEDGHPPKIIRGETLVPLNEALPDDFREVSIKQALEWFAKCEEFSRGSSGSMAPVCALAARQL